MQRFLLIGVYLLLCLAFGRAARSEIDRAQFHADLAALCAPSNRIVGSDGYHTSVAYLRQQIEALPRVELRRHEYAVMVPVTQSAAITLSDGSVEAVHPFWPAMVRVNSTPPEGLEGKLVYCGRCAPQEIRPSELRGQIAVVEASAGARWTEASYFGARAILVLGADDTSHVDLRHHDLLVPVNIPRFYVPPGRLNDRLRDGEITDAVRLRATVTWERRQAVNLYALVAPTVTQMPGWDDAQPPAALMISVPFDSSGLVPDLAKGASQAVQAASGLALLRSLSRQPLNRPVVVYFGGADSIQMLATRNMLLALAENPVRWGPEIHDLERKLSLEREQLARARGFRDAPQSLTIRTDRALLDRIARLVETDAVIEQDQLFRLRMQSAERASQQDHAETARLAGRQIRLNQLRYTFQQRPNDLAAPDVHSDAVHYMDRAIDRLETLIAQHELRLRELKTRQELYRWLADGVGRNPDPRRDSTHQRLIELLVALDLSDRGIRCGPMYFGQFHRMPQVADIQDYRDWFTRISRAARSGSADAEWWNAINRVLDFEPLSQSRAAQTFLAAAMPIGSELPPLWGVPAFSMITLDDLRPRRDTPTDTLENLRVEAILPQLDAVRTLLLNAWNDPAFRGPVERKRHRNQVRGQVVSYSPGRPVPDLAREGFFATWFYTVNVTRRVPQLRSIPWTLGVRRNELQPTDAEGYWQIEALPRIAPNLNADLFVAIEVFRLDPQSGAVIAATDLGRQSAENRPYIDLRNELPPLRSIAFNCEEFSLTGLYDPRYLQPLNEVLPLDARRNAEPQRFNLFLFDKLLAGFVEPGARTQLVLRYGRVGNRMLLLNIPEAAEQLTVPTGRSAGLGFTAAQFNDIEPLSLVTARDFWRLDAMRLSEYRRAGVSSSLVDSLHDLAAAQLQRATDAYAADDGELLVREASGAWASEARVYSAAEEMARDVVRGAIFLLLLCVPFAFVMERLLLASPGIYRQIAWALVIFAVMAAALWAFHPAFKISSSPLIIILAFAIIFMSAVVIAVVYGKFDVELRKIRSGRGDSQDETSFARASVITSAVLLGIANMRRRRFRTALTSITIVLITFSVLCFTSAARYLDTTSLPAGVESAHRGVMLRQRGFRPIPPEILDTLKPVAESVAGPNVTLVQRWWNVNAREPREMVNIVARGGDPSAGPRVVAMSALLGLSPGESKLSPIADVIGPARFARLENGEVDLIFLPQGAAAELGVSEGDTVSIAGKRLEIGGVFDSARFDREVNMLSGESIAPLKYTSGALDASGRRLEDVEAESLDLDAGASVAELSGDYLPLSSSQFAIVPAEVSKSLPNSTLRSIAIRVDTQEQVRQLSDELARRYALALFAGYDQGVRMVAASNLTSVSGAGQVAIPLAIGGLIIFNTMMGSIAERKREIHIYTSLGLAPLHVGALFVAEAMTYGLIGTVFGYIIGQGVGTALLHLGWLGGVTLNYSGTSAIITMGVILLIVLMSALVPARLASKLAAPSIERTWRTPLPKDDQIRAELPFTINKTAADGALAYLAEYFAAHQEGSIGRFSADQVEPFVVAHDDRFGHGLKATIWLTPFDLGVRQHLQLLITPGEFPDIFEVKVVLTRLSGDDGSWYRMNRPFLTELRKQFLQWRSLSPQKMMHYVEESRRAFRR